MMKKKFQWRSERVEREVLITSRKLDFGLPKKAKAVVGKGDFEIYHGICSSIQLFASFWKLTLAHLFDISLRPSFYVNHYLHKQDIAKQDITFDRYYLRFHRSIFMGTGPLFWWNRDCEREPHTSDRFERLVCLWLAILNHSACTQIHQYAKSGSELSKLMLSGSSGSLEDEVKLKEHVQ